MLLNRPLKLKVSNSQDWFLPLCMLQLLAVLAALISPQPVWLTLSAVLIFGAGWIAYILEKTKTNKSELISVIFPDGRVRLESERQVIIEGFLGSQQWCTRWLAVLRVNHGGTTRSLVIRLAHQSAADDFRRLNMWLRQDLFGNTRVGQVLDG